MSDPSEPSGWPEFRARPYVCGAIGAFDPALLRAMCARGPALTPVHEGPDAALHASGRPFRHGVAGFVWGEIAPPASADWLAVAEACESPGLIDDPARVLVHAGGLGLIDLYTVVAGEAAYFASRIEPLLALGQQAIDWSAWASIFVFGAPLADATPFAGVKRLTAATALVFNRQSRRLTSERRLHRAIARAGSGGSAGDVVDALRAAIDGFADQPMILPLSGGWDSRLLAAVIAARGCQVETWTTSPDDGIDADVRLAGPVAAALGLPHRIYLQEEAGLDFREYAPAAWRRFEHQTAHHAWLVPFVRRLHQEGRLVVDGLAGGVLIKGAFASREVMELYSAEDRRDALVAALSLAPGAILPAEARTWVRDAGRAAFDAATAHLRGHRAEESLSVLATRTTRAIARAPFALIGPEIPVRVPFTSPQVIQATLAVDPERKLDGQLYREVFAAAAPAVASLPSTHDDDPDPRRRPRRQAAPPVLDWAHEVVSDLARRLPELVGPELRAALDGGPAAMRHIGLPWLRTLTSFGLWVAEHGDHLQGDLRPPWTRSRAKRAIGAEPAAAAPRDRVEWMVAQVHGERVLDAGCGRGAASIAAARAGRTVIGIDIDPAALAEAKSALASQPPEVQARVRFQLADLLTADLGEGSFECVLLGDLLHQQADPRALVERAIRLLDRDGVLVVTVPFGHHPREPRRTVFYLQGLVRTLAGLCAPVSIDVVDGVIRLVGRREEAAALDAAALLERSEEEFLERELAYRGTIEERERERVRLAAEHERREKRLSAESERLGRMVERLEQRFDRRTADRDRLRGVAAGLRNDLREIKRKGGGRLPPILPPPPTAGRFSRSLAMMFGSIQHEIHLGRAFRRPHTSLVKTFVRVNKAFRTRPALPAAPAEAARPAAAPAAVEVVAEPAAPVAAFSPFTPMIAARPAPITIATVLDTFSEFCFRFEANLVPLSVNGWREEMERHRPAILFCESAWLGNGGQWQYLMSKYASRRPNPLRELLAWCGAEGVPRVFWNKEDPSNFEVFKDVAAEFDHVFTTDADCIPRYRELLGHDRVYALPFAAQPAIHNPSANSPTVEDCERTGSVCFAGSWRARKYPERATDSEILLQPALDLGLEIFDRNAGSKHAAELAFPEPYAAAVRGALEYDAMLTAYRRYKTFLNVNSIKESPTMFARRVFELMACGTPVVSSESTGIRAMLGSLVKIATTPEETRAHLERLLGDGDYRDRFAHAGYREVLEHHTYRHRLETILTRIGVELPGAPPPLVSILAPSNRPERLEHLLGSIRRQIHAPIEVLILLNSDAYDRTAVERAAADLPGVRVFQLPASFTLAECLNHGLEHASGVWVAKFDDDDFYGPHYLSDLLLASRYTDAPILGKRCCFCYLEGSDQLVLRFPELAHREVEFVPGATLLVRREVFDQVRFSPVAKGTDTVFQQDCRAQGIRIYSADPYNFIVFRGADLSSHTWRITEEQMMTRARPVAAGLDTSLVMI